MNFIVIMTDTQNRDMVGAYGNKQVSTPNLDRLAEGGVRFDRAYTSCPLCTPARSALFSGMHSVLNGAWCNNVPVYDTVPLMGSIFRYYGYRAAYTGKWHLDGSGYYGDGRAGGGFEDEWWYDGKRYAEDIGNDMFQKYLHCRTVDDLKAAGLKEDNVWGHRVADRAVDFLVRVQDEPFLLVVSFDEPHSPYVAPPQYWEDFDMQAIPGRPNFGASTAGKPGLQQVHSRHHAVTPGTWEIYRQSLQKHYACNRFIDHEIGRVIETAERLHGDDTVIIYTSDHGSMQGSHGLCGKGPMMYEEAVNVPFIVKVPGGSGVAVTRVPASHLDILPTMLDLAGIPRPQALQGDSLRRVLDAPQQSASRMMMLSFSRYAVNHDDWGGFYPIRCMTDGRYKLVINLMDEDEFYDLEKDPYEMNNVVDCPCYIRMRNFMHDALLKEMDDIRDPFRSFKWGDRRWRSVRQESYCGGERRNRRQGFPFQPCGIEATGEMQFN